MRPLLSRMQCSTRSEMASLRFAAQRLLLARVVKAASEEPGSVLCDEPPGPQPRFAGIPRVGYTLFGAGSAEN